MVFEIGNVVVLLHLIVYNEAPLDVIVHRRSLQWLDVIAQAAAFDKMFA